MPKIELQGGLISGSSLLLTMVMEADSLVIVVWSIITKDVTENLEKAQRKCTTDLGYNWVQVISQKSRM